MSVRSRGSWAVILPTAAGSLLLALAGLLTLGGQQQVVASAPLGTGGDLVAPAVSAPPAGDPAAGPEFRPAGVSGSAGRVPTVLGLPGHNGIPVDPVSAGDGRDVDIPDDPGRVGWWAAGSAPGDDAGSTVVVGHLDSATHGLGAFAALLDLGLGDAVTLRDTAGSETAYVVTGREQVAKAALPASLFTMQGPRRLVLVTCGGRFDPATHHYDDNVIVIAEPRPSP